MHVLVEVNSKFTDEELRKLALGIGIRIYPLSEYDILGEQKTEYPMIKTGLEELDKIIAFF